MDSRGLRILRSTSRGLTGVSRGPRQFDSQTQPLSSVRFLVFVLNIIRQPSEYPCLLAYSVPKSTQVQNLFMYRSTKRRWNQKQIGYQEIGVSRDLRESQRISGEFLGVLRGFRGLPEVLGITVATHDSSMNSLIT